MTRVRKPRVKKEAVAKDQQYLIAHDPIGEVLEAAQEDVAQCCQEVRDQPANQNTDLVQTISLEMPNWMRLNQIRNTCSMWELGNVESQAISTMSRFEFEIALCKAFEKIHKSYDSKAIIYNCSNKNFHKHLKRLGFKKVFSYKGYSSYEDVITFVKKTGESVEKKSFFQRLFS